MDAEDTDTGPEGLTDIGADRTVTEGGAGDGLACSCCFNRCDLWSR